VVVGVVWVVVVWVTVGVVVDVLVVVFGVVSVAVACGDGGGERREIPFGLQDRGFGGDAAATGVFGGLGDRFEVALQRPGVFHGDQPGARAPAGHQHRDDDAQCGGDGDAEADAHGH
jgi:hypothetical protein